MLIAEAFCYRGGRVTGIPLTSERIVRSNLRFAAEFSDIVSAYRPCEEVGSRDTEATATIVWRVFEKLPVGQAPLCWAARGIYRFILGRTSFAQCASV